MSNFLKSFGKLLFDTSPASPKFDTNDFRDMFAGYINDDHRDKILNEYDKIINDDFYETEDIRKIYDCVRKIQTCPDADVRKVMEDLSSYLWKKYALRSCGDSNNGWKGGIVSI